MCEEVPKVGSRKSEVRYMWQAGSGGGGGALSLGKGRKGQREAGPGFVGANRDYFTIKASIGFER